MTNGCADSNATAMHQRCNKYLDITGVWLSLLWFIILLSSINVNAHVLLDVVRVINHILKIEDTFLIQVVVEIAFVLPQRHNISASVYYVIRCR